MSIEEELEELRARSLFRTLRENASPAGPTVTIDGRELVNFGSNDYLGFASEPILREAAKAAIDRYGVGSGASRLISGTLFPHVQLEERLADFKQTKAALSFSSGYAAAVGTLGALLHKGDVVILDKLSHASLVDGARLSGALIRVFPHNSVERLESHLRWARQRHPRARVVVVTESVFSMDGDCPPLLEIVQTKARYGAMLLLDEAHGVGVIGPGGRGLAASLGLGDQVEIQMGTLSKALGASGGYICGSRELIDLLINRARSFIYSTAPPPSIAATSAAAFDLLASETGEQRRQSLRRNIAQLWEANVADGDTDTTLRSAIIPFRCGAASEALSSAQHLAEAGCFVPAIRFPTVPQGAARLRVTVTARHSSGQIAALMRALPPSINTK